MSGGVPEFEIRWADSSEDVQCALGVREQVFCREQGVPASEERDGRDDRALHLLALSEEERLIGTLRLQLGGGVAHIGWVAVERDWRGRGIGSRMLHVALARAGRGGCHEARLASQLAAAGLYRRAGFAVVSEPFVEAGIPHVWMRRHLGTQPPAARAG